MGQGWQGCEDALLLSGWSVKRRVIVMRRELRADLVPERKRKGKGAQTELLFANENEPLKSWKYAVLVINGCLSAGANRATLP